MITGWLPSGAIASWDPCGEHSKRVPNGTYDLGMRFLPKRVVTAVCVILALGGAGRWAFAKWESTYGTPSCSWPLRIHGTATSDQDGLVRCYMQALVTRDTPLMKAVAEKTSGNEVTSAAFRYGRDARAGMATATITPNPSDSTDANVEIRFADGVVEDTGLTNETAFGGPSVWRIDIGTDYYSPGRSPDPAEPAATSTPSV